MKKIFLGLISLLALTGCTKEVEEDYDFELRGNPSTGYEWTCTDKNDLVDIDVKLIATTNDKTVTGAPVMYRYKLTGKKEGETTITCTYKRSWEENETDQTKEYKVIVDKELNVETEEVK